jgi:hypothetical protein
LQGFEFNLHASLRTKGGELIFGGANGFNVFLPDEITHPATHYKAIITDFKLFNQSVTPGENINGRVIFEKVPELSPEISLRHNQNVFSIEFSALNFFHPERTRFKYMLEGFNNQWLETDALNRVATYTNLNPGRYNFQGKGSWQ